MKDITTNFEYKGKDYPAIFNLNVMEKIQGEYDNLDAWSELIGGNENAEPDLKALKFGITEAINEAIDMRNEEKGENEPFVTTKFVGRMLTEIGIEKASELFFETVQKSTEDESIADEKNE